MYRVWAIQYGTEYMEMNEDGFISRPQIAMPASGQWQVTGAVERDNFGRIVCRLSLDDVKAACNSIQWQHKNGKQRIFITDLDHGTPREWRSPSHSVRSFVALESLSPIRPVATPHEVQ